MSGSFPMSKVMGADAGMNLRAEETPCEEAPPLLPGDRVVVTTFLCGCLARCDVGCLASVLAVEPNRSVGVRIFRPDGKIVVRHIPADAVRKVLERVR